MTPLRSAVKWMARSPLRAFIIIFLLGFSIRVGVLSTIPERRILPNDLTEDAAIATSLIERGQFADPYVIPTGPTAHLPPLVPGILTLIWSVFGMGLAGGYAIYLLSITAFSALYALLPWFGGKLGLGGEAGVLAGIVGTLIVMRPGMQLGNGEELAAIVLGLLAIAFLRRWTEGLGSFGGSLLLGAACGAAYHLQPVLLPVVLGWMVFELWRSRDRRKWYLSALLILGMAIACAPWAWRNYTVLGDAYFIRSDLGLELRMGNHDGATGNADAMASHEYRHPRSHPDEARQVRDLGEAEYMRRARVEAVDWIRAHPGRFLGLTASRTVQFWLGPFDRPGIALAITGLTILALLGAWRALPAMTPEQIGALVIPLICYPLVYYIVIYMPRYRIPLDWILLLLAGAAAWHWLEGPQRTAISRSPR
jgi:hypothetical protein